MKRLRCDLFDSIVSQEIAFFDETSTGDLLSRLSSDCQMLQTALTVNMSMLLRFTIQALGAMIFLVMLSWKLSLIMFSCMQHQFSYIKGVPLIVFGSVTYGNYISTIQDKFQEKLADSQSVAEEVISQVTIFE